MYNLFVFVFYTSINKARYFNYFNNLRNLLFCGQQFWLHRLPAPFVSTLHLCFMMAFSTYVHQPYRQICLSGGFNQPMLRLYVPVPSVISVQIIKVSCQWWAFENPSSWMSNQNNAPCVFIRMCFEMEPHCINMKRDSIKANSNFQPTKKSNLFVTYLQWFIFKVHGFIMWNRQYWNEFQLLTQNHKAKGRLVFKRRENTTNVIFRYTSESKSLA